MYGEPYSDEIDETVDKNHQKLFYSEKHAWKRLIIVTGGPLANLILSFTIFISIFMFAGAPEMKAIIGAVLQGSPAERAGIKAGDVITSVSGENIKYWRNFIDAIQIAQDQKTIINLVRDRKQISLSITPEIKQHENNNMEVKKNYAIGVKSSMEYQFIKVSVVESLQLGTGKTIYALESTIKMLTQMIKGNLSVKHISGPMRIAELSAIMANKGIVSYLNYFAIISIGLAVMNMFPMPALDGGHILFLLYEMAFGKAPTKRAYEISSRIGITTVSMIMCLALYNDISKMF
jgi:regulator of sigma E protease